MDPGSHSFKPFLSAYCVPGSGHCSKPKINKSLPRGVGPIVSWVKIHRLYTKWGGGSVLEEARDSKSLPSLAAKHGPNKGPGPRYRAQGFPRQSLKKPHLGYWQWPKVLGNQNPDSGKSPSPLVLCSSPQWGLGKGEVCSLPPASRSFEEDTRDQSGCCHAHHGHSR